MRRQGGEMSRNQPILTPTDSSFTATPSTPMMSTAGKANERGRSKAGQAVGGTAALICCFPCAVINLVVLAVYKVPSGLCKRAWRRNKRLQRRRLLKKRNRSSASLDGLAGVRENFGGIGMEFSSDDGEDEDDEEDEESDMDKLEEEMWGEFYRGFWRSPSQKED